MFQNSGPWIFKSFQHHYKSSTCIQSKIKLLLLRCVQNCFENSSLFTPSVNSVAFPLPAPFPPVIVHNAVCPTRIRKRQLKGGSGFPACVRWFNQGAGMLPTSPLVNDSYKPFTILRFVSIRY
ncbi:hypothetical protein SAMN04488121_105167 [Chitinophaga filiformis]|uniref:Uncharacterized protein n=1 Tax=Chitinophaga filiformis TaxID=104663 RepID=A0A1G7VLD8_CHIFI|nr:hypothetical protein SAMN04488121_105167 [Chitinophaga filiformis]